MTSTHHRQSANGGRASKGVPRRRWHIVEVGIVLRPGHGAPLVMVWDDRTGRTDDCEFGGMEEAAIVVQLIEANPERRPRWYDLWRDARIIHLARHGGRS